MNLKRPLALYRSPLPVIIQSFFAFKLPMHIFSISFIDGDKDVSSFNQTKKSSSSSEDSLVLFLVLDELLWLLQYENTWNLLSLVNICSHWNIITNALDDIVNEPNIREFCNLPILHSFLNLPRSHLDHVLLLYFKMIHTCWDLIKEHNTLFIGLKLQITLGQKP